MVSATTSQADAVNETRAVGDPPAVRRPFVLAAVMAASFMIAIEATIVSTAMPQIAGQLGDLHYYS